MKPTMSFLFCFAHRGEAQIWLESAKWQALTTNLYQDDYKNYLLITGEGPWEASSELFRAFTCDLPRDQRYLIINIGLVGAFAHADLEIGQIVLPQTFHLAYPKGEMEFQTFSFDSSLLKSFPSLMNASLKKVDLVTSFERHHQESAAIEKMKLFADVVDRESWALAQCAKSLQHPFISIKVVSDQITQMHNVRVCDFVKEKAESFLIKLWPFFDQHFFQETITLPLMASSHINLELEDLTKHLYLTHSHRQQWHELLKKMANHLNENEQNKIVQNLHLIINDQHFRPKEKTKMIIELIQKTLDPEKWSWILQLQALQKTLQEHFHIHLSAPQQLEDLTLKLSFDIHRDQITQSSLLSPEVKIILHDFFDQLETIR
jgi:hypothetical protein